MTREEIMQLNTDYLNDCESEHEMNELFDYVMELQKQEQQTRQFAEWVATYIFDDTLEYNQDAFVELACRKLAKLGIVIRMGDEWELVEPQESEKV